MKRCVQAGVRSSATRIINLLHRSCTRLFFPLQQHPPIGNSFILNSVYLILILVVLKARILEEKKVSWASWKGFLEDRLAGYKHNHTQNIMIIICTLHKKNTRNPEKWVSLDLLHVIFFILHTCNNNLLHIQDIVPFFVYHFFFWKNFTPSSTLQKGGSPRDVNAVI